RTPILRPSAYAEGVPFVNDAILLRPVRQARDRRMRRASAEAQAGCFRGTLCSHRQPESTHFGCSASHSCAYSCPRTRQAGNDKPSSGRCSVQEPGAPCRQKTSTSAVMRPSITKLTLAALLLSAAPAEAEDNDYPTAARADYLIGCMAANGNTREALLKCSCAIDT